LALPPAPLLPLPHPLSLSRAIACLGRLQTGSEVRYLTIPRSCHGKMAMQQDSSSRRPDAPSPLISAAQSTLASPRPMSQLGPSRHRHNRHLSTETFRDRHPRSFRTTLTKPPIPSRRPVALGVPDALAEDREPVTTSGNFSSTSRPDYIEQPIPSLSTPYPASRTPTTTSPTTHPPTMQHPSVLVPLPLTPSTPAPSMEGFESFPAEGSSPNRRQRISMACQYCRHR
jgi:hypothetical protein